LAVVGIDVSKSTFDAHLLTPGGKRGKHFTFATGDAVVGKFTAWLKRVAPGGTAQICMEETGCYGRKLAKILHEAGHTVSLVNPNMIKRYGESLNVRTKNDRADAWLIASYALERAPRAWTPPPSGRAELIALKRRRDQLVNMVRTANNHIEADSGDSAEVTASLARNLATQEAELQRISNAMKDAIALDKEFKETCKLLQTIPGVGPTTAMGLIAELPDLRNFTSSRELCAYAGLSPREEKSGSSVRGRTRLCKQGRTALRSLTYMPALTVKRMKDGPFAKFVHGMEVRGKEKMCIVGALMRKIMAVVFAVMKSGNKYDAARHVAKTAITT